MQPPIKGRGTSDNPSGRFEKIAYEVNEYADDPFDDPAPVTQFLRDDSKTLITYNDSPDVGFDASINVYRGCEHGCIYCFARPTHEFLGFSPGLDFETRILVKENAPQLLREELSSRKWNPQVLAMSGVTDPYQPIERKLRLTRRCLEVLVEFRNPVCVITKSHLVTRDTELYAELAGYNAAMVNISLTSLDERLARVLEPRAAAPERRLAAIRALSEAGVPVRALMAPIIPAINDHELPAMAMAAREAGAKFAGYVALRLPYGLKDLFSNWLEQHFPDRKERVLSRLRSMRGGELNDPNFKTRMRGEGAYADQIKALFKIACRKAGLSDGGKDLSVDAFERPGARQLELF
ncbi:MAG: PA0069 family radical SAM protein [Armatimonadetes bacterium]|nr:PA0069 family radical SAM protein [Armatimonadota bacterium]